MKIKKLLQNIFSVRNQDFHKVVTLAGLKIKFKRNDAEIKLILDRIKKPFLYSKDSWEMSYLEKFYQDIQKRDYQSSYQNLVKNLDNSSIETVNKILVRAEKVCKSDSKAVDIFDNPEMNLIENAHKSFYGNSLQLNENCWAFKQYLLPVNHYEMCVFEDKHCIDSLNKDYFKDKDIIDAGAFIGDSAIVLSDYTSRNVHSFEPTSKNFQLLQQTIKLNNKDNIVAVNSALGDVNGEIELFTNDSASGILDVKDVSTKETCRVTTLDDYVRENNLTVGLIKTDLEGAEQLFLKGAENTIKEQRPTLLISIYHTAGDFFDIKPMIESWNLNYSFKIVKPIDGQILLETLLICEPKEI